MIILWLERRFVNENFILRKLHFYLITTNWETKIVNRFRRWIQNADIILKIKIFLSSNYMKLYTLQIINFSFLY